jgi:hypothetical protein
MLPYTPGAAQRLSEYRVLDSDHPGWERGDARGLKVGEAIYCAAGMGTVGAVHGKTGDGSRLVQVAFDEPRRAPFFAAASNLLLPPATPEVSPLIGTLGSTPTEWIGERSVNAPIG